MPNNSMQRSMQRLTGRNCCSSTRAFTLVELLVVIGIIALLISILLPSLQAARRTAQRTACAAKLHQLMLAAAMHRNDHRDYYPLCGVLVTGSTSDGPQDFDDPYKQKYVYDSSLTSNGQPFDTLAPITYALETEMAGGKSLYAPGGPLNSGSASRDTYWVLDPGGLNRNFICPAHVTSPLDILPTFEYLFVIAGSAGSYACQPQSYIFNEYVLGWNDNYGFNYLKGKSTLIHRPAETMFAADGVGGSTTANHAGNHGLFNPIYTVYPNTGTGPATLADAFNAPATGGTCGDKKNFDLIRHRGKVNIAFCDGHVEARNITGGDLGNVFILPP